jgi:hypothetical protein
MIQLKKFFDFLIFLFAFELSFQYHWLYQTEASRRLIGPETVEEDKTTVQF